MVVRSSMNIADNVSDCATDLSHARAYSSLKGKIASIKVHSLPESLWRRVDAASLSAQVRPCKVVLRPQRLRMRYGA